MIPDPPRYLPEIDDVETFFHQFPVEREDPSFSFFHGRMGRKLHGIGFGHLGHEIGRG